MHKLSATIPSLFPYLSSPPSLHICFFVNSLFLNLSFSPDLSPAQSTTHPSVHDHPTRRPRLCLSPSPVTSLPSGGVRIDTSADTRHEPSAEGPMAVVS